MFVDIMPDDERIIGFDLPPILWTHQRTKLHSEKEVCSCPGKLFNKLMTRSEKMRRKGIYVSLLGPLVFSVLFYACTGANSGVQNTTTTVEKTEPKPEKTASAPEAEWVDPMNETKEQRDARMAWWREARFGLFIHWGVYAVPAGTYEGERIKGIGEWIMLISKIPVAK